MRTKTRRWIVGSLVGFLSFEGETPACLIVRPPLWELVGDSDLIAVVKVRSFERDPSVPGCAESPAAGLDCDVAVLQILETWKGSLRREVRVNFSGSLSADADEIAVGDQLVVFLETGENQYRRIAEAAAEGHGVPEITVDDASAGTFEDSEELLSEQSGDEALPQANLARLHEEERRWRESRLGRWVAAGFGLGNRKVSDGDVRPLRAFVDGAIELQDSGQISASIIREWLVQGAAVASTRVYALEDLQQLLGVVSDSGEEVSKSSLTEIEQKTLANGFIRDPSGDSSTPILLSLLSGYEDADLDRAFVSVIGTAFAAPQIPAWTPDAIRHLIVRRGWRDWGAEMWRKDLESGSLRERWPLLLKDLDLREAPPGGASAAR